MNKIGKYFTLIAGGLWGCMGLYVRTFDAANISTSSIVLLRTTFSCLIMGLFILFGQRDLFKIKPKDLWIFIGNGIVSLALFSFCYNKCIVLTSLSTASVLLYTAPVFVMIISFFLFKEKLGKAKITALIMTVLGCIFVSGITGGASNLTLPGFLCGLYAGFGYGLYSIFSRFAINRGYKTMTITFYTYLFGTLFLIPISDRISLVNYWREGPVNIIFSMTYVVMSTVIPYALYSIGLRYVDNGKGSIMASIEPVVATVIGITVFSEKMTATGLIGMILVLLAVVICNIPGKEKKVTVSEV